MISVFLPTRAGSKRVKNKNTRVFNGFEGGLLKIKLEQLISLKNIHEIILSTNDKKSIEIAKEFFGNNSLLKIVKRPNSLALDSTKLSDLIAYAESISKYEHILWTHVTSPFFKTADYHDAIHSYEKALKNGYDSLMSVNVIQNFIWSPTENCVMNKREGDTSKWPRTQDLSPVYEVNSAVFLAGKKIYKEHSDRVGSKPFLYEVTNWKSFDIDWEEDFKVAEILYDKLG